MINKTSLLKIFDLPLKKAGFTKKGQSWYLDGLDSLIVVNLENIEMFSKGHYVVNIGFWLKIMGDANFLPYNHCHMYYRVERLLPEYQNILKIGASLSTGDSQSLINLANFNEKILIPFLQECTSITKLKELYADGILNRGYMKFEVREYLEGL